jgi:serine/threonine-protein kinase
MSTAPRVGEILDGKYRILRKLGQGGMGAVFAGEHLRVEKVVAIKVLHAAASEVAEMADRFEREARAAGKIGNEHIVEVYDLGMTPGGERYIVMEYLDGESLRARIARQKRMTVRDIAGLSLQLLDGLAAAHEAGVVHRDLKPDNIYLTKGKRGFVDFVKILDFGISKFNEAEGSKTKTGTVLGSPNYMSPEHIRASDSVDARSDLYGVGVILFEAVTGQLPRKGANFAELLFKVAYEPFPEPRALVPDLPEAFAAIIKRACANDPAERFQSADEMAEALAPFAPSPEEQRAHSPAARRTQGGVRQAIANAQIVESDDEARTMALVVDSPSSSSGVSLQGTAVISPMPMVPGAGGGPPGAGGSQPSFASQPGFAPGFISQPGHSQPGHSQPGLSQPGLSQPGLSQSGLSHSGLSQPWGAHPVVPEPARSQPSQGGSSQPSFAGLPATGASPPSQPNFGNSSQATLGGAVSPLPPPKRSGVALLALGVLVTGGLGLGTYLALSMRAQEAAQTGTTGSSEVAVAAPVEAKPSGGATASAPIEPDATAAPSAVAIEDLAPESSSEPRPGGGKPKSSGAPAPRPGTAKKKGPDPGF